MCGVDYWCWDVCELCDLKVVVLVCWVFVYCV